MQPEAAAPGAYTLPQFLARFNVPRTTFYSMAKNGRAPRTMRVGRQIRISHQAALDWVARLEAETAEVAA